MNWKTRKILTLSKDAHKFSAAHMTVFADGTKERLHGHNYSVQLELELASSEDFVEFAKVKKLLAGLCDEWDERLLLPAGSRFFKSQAKGSETEFHLCAKRYVVPTDECVLLPVDNITVESLAEILAKKYVQTWTQEAGLPALAALQITVQETTGQSGRVRLEQEQL